MGEVVELAVMPETESAHIDQSLRTLAECLLKDAFVEGGGVTGYALVIWDRAGTRHVAAQVNRYFPLPDHLVGEDVKQAIDSHVRVRRESA